MAVKVGKVNKVSIKEPCTAMKNIHDVLRHRTRLAFLFNSRKITHPVLDFREFKCLLQRFHNAKLIFQREDGKSVTWLFTISK